VKAGERSTLRSITGVGLIAVALLSAPGAFSWGPEGHSWINLVAAQKIPREMPLFFRQATDELAYLGPEPDRWRNLSEGSLKYSQEPDHFINLEKIDWLNPLPESRYEFYRKLYEKRAATSDDQDQYLPERVGLQPYITMEVFGRLKAAFREYRNLQKAHKSTAPVENAIVFYAGWLGHYVGDAAQPLHTSVSYNGWVGPNPAAYTTERGIHWKFEGVYVAHNLHPSDFAGLVNAPEHLANPFAQYMDYLRQSHTQVEKVYQLEKAGSFSGKGSAEARAFTASRLAAGSQMLLNLWYTAWLDSAQPPVPPKYE
jgi:hypothetical protein